MTHMHPGLPFLFDDVTENMVGLKQPNGAEKLLLGPMANGDIDPVSAAAHALEHAGMGVNPGLSKYTGIVADRTRLCYNLLTNLKQGGGLLGFYAMDDITPATELQIVDVGFSSKASGIDQFDLTTHYAIEYAGVVTPIKYSGNSTGTVAAGGTIVSDVYRPPVTIPRGARALLHVYKTSTVGLPMVGGVNIPYCDHNAGDKFEYAASGLTDKVGIGGWTNTDSTGGFSSPPFAIIGKTARRSFAMVTDSRGTGILDHWGNYRRHRGVLERSICPYFGNTSISQSSMSIATLIGQPLMLAAANAYASDIIIQMGTNDLGAGVSTIKSRLETLIAAFPGKRVWVTTINPITTSTDSWATLANQTVGANEADRVGINYLIRGNAIAGMYGCLDTADVCEMARSGKWNTAYTSDPSQYVAFEGLHETSLMCQAIAQARVIDPLRLGYT